MIFVFIFTVLIGLLIYFRRTVYRLFLYFKNKNDIGMITLFIGEVVFCAAFIHMEFTLHKYVMLKNVIMVIFLLFFLACNIYFMKVWKHARKIEKLYEERENVNKKLNQRITELRKIKHDYGSELSTLYGLCQLGDYDRLYEMLGSIIHRNNAASLEDIASGVDDPIMQAILRPATALGIKTVFNSNIKLREIPVDTFGFTKIMSNIISNAVTALKEKNGGIIKITIEDTCKDILVSIENNGPPIPEDIIDHIFDTGITTKVNDDGEHGFGLAIVKELVENYGGNISVESDEISTEFVVTLPKCNTTH